ncbi:MAG: VRR-NUC domain [Rhodobacteraceae bacterium HLUCCO07]|nr:MAG: VRR-NUC domain [Rhodobacteraceae bacterium HLUCCO07]
MNRRSTPEADAQRAIVQALRIALPRDAIVHHCANEIAASDRRGRIRQSILVGMGVHPGFADLIVISGGHVLFLEVKSETGRLRKSQAVFRDTVCAQGFGWALVRSVDDALGALADHGFTSRAQPARRAAP